MTRMLAGRERWRHLVRHYVEMVLAMVVGMATLYPSWAALVGGSGAAWVLRPETDALAMATAMAVPMAAWMLVRGHAVPATTEMCLAMYAGFAVFFPFLWSGLIDEGGLLGLGHVAMLLLMALAMLRRPQEYAVQHCPAPRRLQRNAHVATPRR